MQNSRPTSDNLRRGSTRFGFTLIEVMVALTIGIIVLVGARIVLNQIADSADRVTAASIVSDRIANTERTARALIEHTFAADSIDIFQGSSSSVSFTSWCDMPSGWKEPCTVVLEVVPVVAVDTLLPNQHRVAVQLITSAGDQLRLYDSLPGATLRYLEDPTNGGVWRPSWPSGMTTPLAIGIVLPNDTIIFRIGERR